MVKYKTPILVIILSLLVIAFFVVLNGGRFIFSSISSESADIYRDSAPSQKQDSNTVVTEANLGESEETLPLQKGTELDVILASVYRLINAPDNKIQIGNAKIEYDKNGDFSKIHIFANAVMRKVVYTQVAEYQNDGTRLMKPGETTRDWVECSIDVTFSAQDIYVSYKSGDEVENWNNLFTNMHSYMPPIADFFSDLSLFMSDKSYWGGGIEGQKYQIRLTIISSTDKFKDDVLYVPKNYYKLSEGKLLEVEPTFERNTVSPYYYIYSMDHDENILGISHIVKF